MRFDYSGRTGKVSLLEPLIGQSGWLSFSRLSVEALDQAEDHLILAGMTELGAALDEQVVARLLRLPGTVSGDQSVVRCHRLARSPPRRRSGRRRNQRGISERNAQFFSAEADKLDGWADDLKLGLEREIKELDRQIKEARRAARQRSPWRKSSPPRSRSGRLRPSGTISAGHSSTHRIQWIGNGKT